MKWLLKSYFRRKSFNGQHLKIVIFVILLVTVVFNLYVYQDMNPLYHKFYHGQKVITGKYRNDFSQSESDETLKANCDPKKNHSVILLWNDLYGKINWGFSREPEEDFKRLGCSETRCVVTDDRSRLNEADSIMFHMVGDLSQRPPFKLGHQRWVFLEHESPGTDGWVNVLKHWDGYFNWTQTYRLDSDIPMTYLNFCKRDKWITIDYKQILKRKSKHVAWMVGNCNDISKRHAYVTELMKYIPVDIFGACAKLYNQNNQCSRKHHNECMQMLDEKYKFYLSFENCFDKDYVTEKYFNMLTINIVPVVRGDGNYTAVGPPQSYINTKDFKNPRQLADYLNFLNKNDEEYIKYLKWKEMFRSDPNDSKCWTVESAYCLLCKKLRNSCEPAKVYESIVDWFGKCREADDYN